MAVEVPILLSFFVGTDPTDLWPNKPTQTGPTQGEVSVYDDQLVSRLYFFLSTLVIIATFYGYFYHESTLPGNLILELYALGSSTDGAFGDSTILQVLANFTEIQVHSAGLTNQTGWHTIMQPRDPYVSDLTSHLCRIGAVCVSWAARLAPGAYDYLKFNSSNIFLHAMSQEIIS